MLLFTVCVTCMRYRYYVLNQVYNFVYCGMYISYLTVFIRYKHTYMYTDSLVRISGTSDTTFSRLSVCLWQS